jgi:hypothetical protein
VPRGSGPFFVPDAETLPQSPAPEAPASAPAAAPESAAQPYLTWQDRLARAFDHLPADDPRAVSNGSVADPPKPEPKDAPEEPAEDDDDESPPEVSKSDAAPTPDEGKPADPPKLSRRQQEAAAKEARIRELEAERDAAVTKAREEARAEFEREQQTRAEREQQEALARSSQADIERFERLNRLPDDHPTLAEGDNWAWLQERKRLLASFPEADKHYRTWAERVVAERTQGVEQTLASEREGFWNGVRAEMRQAATLPNTSAKDLEIGAEGAPTTFAEIAAYYHARGAGWKEAELAPQVAERDQRIAQHEEKIAELEDEIKDLRLVGPRGLGSARAATTGGASGSSEAHSRRFNESRPAKDNLAAALGF